LGLKATSHKPYAKVTSGDVTVNKPARSKQASSQNVRAWNDKGSNETVFFVGFYTENV